ncbi:MAG: DUF4105 domain-containing protein [Chthoniobacterales bacterium]
MMLSILKFVGWTVIWLAALVYVLWAAGALYFDFPVAALRRPAAIIFLLVILGGVIFVPTGIQKLAAVLVCLAAVTVWWLSLKPSNDRPWQPDVVQTAWAEMNGDQITLHNVRNCDYRTETDYTAQWETRQIRLSQITGVDLAVDYWGSPYIAHPIASFQFTDAPPICFSIETRKEVGETYSAVGGLYRQYELIYICADERDVLRVRTNYRKAEDVYLYRISASPEKARERFVQYLTTLNSLRDRPRWYNAATTNCTTSIRAQNPTNQRIPWDWRILFNGKGDEMLYERHAIATGGLSFPELKQRSLINDAAHRADQDLDFSRRIREGLPWF